MMMCWIVSVGLTTTGCASKNKIEFTRQEFETALAVTLGGAAGLTVGHHMGRGTRRMRRRMSSVNGLLVGALIGGLGYYTINHSLKKRDEKVRRKTLLDLESFQVQGGISKKRRSYGNGRKNGLEDSRGYGQRDILESFSSDELPFNLSSPQVRKECFDWQVKGRRLIQNHCVWWAEGRLFWVPSTEKKINSLVPKGRKD